MRPCVLRFATLLLILGSALNCPAKEQPAPPRVNANKLLQLREHIGKPITALGKVATTNTSRSGNHFLNMEGRVLTVICFPQDVKKFTAGKPAELYKGKSVEVTGVLSEYKGKIQLKLTAPEHIKLVDPSSLHQSANSTKKTQPVTLREVGDGVFMSPAGLIYKGKDPQGLSRVDHVRRHMRDIPTRAGSHGVFNGPEETAWAVIDEAWNLGQSRRVRPNVERNRATITVSMGRPIGYLGGANGARRNHPKLSKVFIVYERNTKNIVTAFPK